MLCAPRFVFRRHPDGALTGNGTFMLADAAADATVGGNDRLLETNQNLDMVPGLRRWVKWIGSGDRYGLFRLPDDPFRWLTVDLAIKIAAGIPARQQTDIA